MKLTCDSERMNKLISSMRQSCCMLGELTEITENDFLKDHHKQGSAKYNFITAIEACIDISNHLISKNKMRAAKDYADTFEVLAENKIIDSDFSQELMKMARFRNLLVHLYWNVDSKELYSILCQNQARNNTINRKENVC